MDNLLFEEKEDISHERCNNCKHRQRWASESGKVFQYCGVTRSNRTDNGLLKIKCKDKACRLYKKKDEVK